ncbi:MAG: sulfotransferase family protein [Shimia sp.]
MTPPPRPHRPRNHRYVFVGGLHRSGTSLVARMIARLPGVGAISGAPVPEDEGAYLQGAIPHDALAGRPMHFATDPAQHLTEAHPLNRLETRTRLEADWAPWFPPGCVWRVEKSPVNLVRMRLLQQLFPLAQFVVVLRHPEAVAAATAKWVDAPASRMHAHWSAAHRVVAGDLPRLHAVLVLRYEDVVADPCAAMRALAAFLDVTPAAPPGVRNGNADYPDAQPMATDEALWGYAPGGRVLPEGGHLIVAHPLRAMREATATALVRAGAGTNDRGS